MVHEGAAEPWKKVREKWLNFLERLKQLAKRQMHDETRQSWNMPVWELDVE